MQRRKFSREFKVEAVKLIKDRGYLSRKRAATWASMRMFCANG